MANEKISELPAGGPALTNDIFPIARTSNSSNYALGVSDILNLVTAVPYGIGISAGVSSQTSGAVTFGNSNGISFGLSAGVMTATVIPGAAAGIAAMGAGASTITNGTVILSNSNGMSFGAAGGVITGSYTVPNVASFISNLGLSASNTSGRFTGITFSNSNNISFGMSNGTITASVVPGGGGVGTASIYAIGNSTGLSYSGSMPLTSFNISGAGIISVGFSSNTMIISAPGSTGLSQSIQIIGNTALAASGTQSIGSLLISAAGAVTCGVTNGSLFISGATVAGAPINFSAGTTSGNLGSVVFSNANGVSWGLQGSTLTGSVPAISSLVGAGGMSVSTVGSTISVFEQPLTRLIWPPESLTGVSAPANGQATFQYVPIAWPVTASRLDALVEWSAGSSATNATAAIALSAWAAIYTRNGSTLSSLSSGSTQTTYTYASNSAGQTQLQAPAIRPISVPMNMSVTPGEYFVGFNFSTTASSIGLTTTNIGQTISMIGGNNIQSALNYAEFTAATNNTTNLYGGMGVLTAASAGLGASVALSNISQGGASLSQANVAIVFRNA